MLPKYFVLMPREITDELGNLFYLLEVINLITEQATTHLTLSELRDYDQESAYENYCKIILQFRIIEEHSKRSLKFARDYKNRMYESMKSVYLRDENLCLETCNTILIDKYEDLE
jgi:hypothetical protein